MSKIRNAAWPAYRVALLASFGGLLGRGAMNIFVFRIPNVGDDTLRADVSVRCRQKLRSGFGSCDPKHCGVDPNRDLQIASYRGRISRWAK